VERCAVFHARHCVTAVDFEGRALNAPMIAA
jgi:hypothetical protein